MNFNYSYKAFLISSLLVGNLVLLLVSVKLQKKQVVTEETVPVEYLETLPEEFLDAEANTTSAEKITTNTAYNEAEAFIRNLENERNSVNTEIEPVESEKTSVTENPESIDFNKIKEDIEDATKALEEANNLKPKEKKGVNKKTTISYSLKNRKAISLRNPVYTCDSGGKIVINIEVNALGKVVKQKYNATLSTSNNGCLIDAALVYAKKSRFNTKSGVANQLGTITYSFPGQD